MVDLHSLPSVEQLLQTEYAAELTATFGRPLTTDAIRTVLDAIRTEWRSGVETTLPIQDSLLEQARARLIEWTTSTLRTAINATGVILHTNLGRAPLSTASLQAMDAVSRGYSSLEFDLVGGKRGSRLVHAEALLQRLTGAEAAVVVNNNAAAILLALAALASRKRVVIARSQLVEIGGGFRVPDIMKQSRAKLVEVGTTNRIHFSDYEEALSEPAGLVMHVHRSNFKMIGFTGEPGLGELVETAHRHGVPCVDDLGSGALLDTAQYGLAHEPTIQESLKAGADLVCFSGDKLLGGPQAGIIVGKAELVARLKKHPLARALRADKLCLAALTATLLHYLKDEAVREIPLWRMIAATPDEIKARAEGWATELKRGEVIWSMSTIGGGSLPGENLPTYVLALDVRMPDAFLEKLRRQQPPVIARTENDRILLDPRTVSPEQEGALYVALLNVLQEDKRTAGRKRG